MLLKPGLGEVNEPPHLCCKQYRNESWAVCKYSKVERHVSESTAKYNLMIIPTYIDGTCVFQSNGIHPQVLHMWKTAHGFPTMIAIRRFRVTKTFTRGCRPKALPKRPPRVHPQTRSNKWQLLQTTAFTCAVNIQSPKGHLFALVGTSIACYKLQKQEMARPYILGRPLGFI